MGNASGRDRKLDDEAKRLKSEADKAETPRERQQFEKYSDFFDSLAEDGEAEEGTTGAADDKPVRSE